MSQPFKTNDLFPVGSVLAATGTTASNPIDIRKYLQFGYQYKVQSSAVGDASAALTNQAITYTSDVAGEVGNAIKIKLTVPVVDNATADFSYDTTTKIFEVTLAGTSAKYASGTVTILNYAAMAQAIPDTIAVAGVTFTASSAAVVAGAATFRSEFTNAMTAQSLCDQINNHATTSPLVLATFSANIVTVTAKATGTAANSYGLVYTNNGNGVGASVSGATMTGGGIEVLVEFSDEPVAGTWKVSFNGEESASVAYDDADTDLETALQALTGLETCTVTGDYASGFTVFIPMDADDYLADGPLTISSNSLLDVEAEAAEAAFAPNPGWTSKDLEFTSVALGADRNGQTFTTYANTAAANEEADDIIAEFSGTPEAIVLTITPNNGDNNVENPAGPAYTQFGYDPVLQMFSVEEGSVRNGTTIQLCILPAAPNSDDKVLVAYDGTEDDIVITVTPNDGTNNTATPVSITYDEFCELNNTGVVAGKDVVITDALSLRLLQDTWHSDNNSSDLMTNGGIGDNQIATFVGGHNDTSDITYEEAAELINTGAVAGKNITVIDPDNLRILQTCTISGGDVGDAVQKYTDWDDNGGFTFQDGVDAIDEVETEITVGEPDEQFATGTISISSYAILPGDTISIGGIDFVAQTAAVVSGENTFRCLTSNGATAISLAAQINAHAEASLLVEAQASSDDVNLTSLVGGDSGNFALSYTNAGLATGLSVSGATMLGGAALAITSTATNLVAAINASPVSDNLITASGSGASALIALAATNLASGTDAVGSLTGSLQLQISNDAGYVPGDSDGVVSGITNWSSHGSAITLTSVDATGVSAIINSGSINANWVRLLYTPSGADDPGVIQSRYTAKR